MADSKISALTSYSQGLNADLIPIVDTLNTTTKKITYRNLFPDFNVKAYGCKGDGSTNDTANFQAAIDAANTAGGGIIRMPAGNYKLVTNALKLYSGSSPTITPYSNLIFIGEGSSGIGGTIITQTSTGVDVIKGLNDANNGAQALNCYFLNFCMAFSGTATNSGNGIYLAQQAANGPSFQQFFLQNVTATGFQGSGKYGFNIESIIASGLDVCQAVDCANGFWLNGDSAGTGFSSVCTSTLLRNCYSNLSTNGVNGFRCTDNTYVKYDNCASDFGSNSTGSAYLCEGSNDVHYDTCGVELNGTVSLTNGFKIAADANSNPSFQIKSTSCYSFQPKSTVSFYVTGTSTGIFVDTFQVNSSVSGDTGLKVDAGSQVTEIACDFSAATTPRTIATTGIDLRPAETRVTTTTTATTITPNAGTTDIYKVTALASNLTIAAPTGTPNDGDTLTIAFLDAGVAKTLTWNAIYRAIGTSLPTTTTANKQLYVRFIYNANATKWDEVQISLQT